MKDLSPQVIDSFNSALEKLTGASRRALAAEICIEFFDSSPTKMERHLKVGREMVQLGLNEHRTGIQCLDAYGLRGAKKKRRTIPT
jgi:hypothetical protein